MKKLFHRKKNSAPSSPEQRPSASRQTQNVNADSGLRTSRYESTAPAGLPQTGQFPLKGNSSSVSFQGRRSETYARGGQPNVGPEHTPRPSSSSPYYGSLPSPRVTSASYNHTASDLPPNNEQQGPRVTNNHQRRQQYATTNGPPTEGFANLNLNSTADQLSHQEVPLRQHHEASSSAAGKQHTAFPTNKYERYPYQNDDTPGIRMVEQPQFAEDHNVPQMTSNTRLRDQDRFDFESLSQGKSGTQPSSNAFGRMPDDNGAVRRKNSIPRKEIPNASHYTPRKSEPANSSSLPINQNHQGTSSIVSPNQYDDSDRQPAKRDSRPNYAIPTGSRTFAPDSYISGQEVLDRARANTYDTEVVEKVAPAVIHERVHKDIHHVREEVITKEIHEHDVYHRILPIIDVEVLPPRHFLPVEGGGLVEISGKEVPGRGNNWVVAETASKIPSDQPAPKGSRAFSARHFPGTEGDAVKYSTPEGLQRTEQTWVHRPELETGGRDSGQTWPMEFGGESIPKSGRDRKASKSSKARHAGKSLEQPSSTLQQQRI